MSGFDTSELLPFYLDETDEQIALLNDALLRLENDPGDAAALQETFRLAHSIKGSSRLMGFEQVEKLTHDLESYFDLLRSGKRSLDRAALNICFRVLDSLRDFHQALRKDGRADHDLSGPVTKLLELLSHDSAAPTSPPASVESELLLPPASEPPLIETGSPNPTEPLGHLHLTIRFEQGLLWKDMKARLILSRLSERVRVVRSEPPLDRIEEVERVGEFQVWLLDEASHEEIRTLADLDGVTLLRIESEALSLPSPEPVQMLPPRPPEFTSRSDAPLSGEPTGPIAAERPSPPAPTPQATRRSARVGEPCASMWIASTTS